MSPLTLASSSSDGEAAFVILLTVVAAMYLIPSIVAAVRKVPNAGSVYVINVLLGWTLIGWVVSMAMAARSVPAQPPNWGGHAPMTHPGQPPVR